MAGVNIAELKKAELHVHLEGSLETETLQQIDPSLSPGEIRAATTYQDFNGFIQSFVWVNRKLLRPEHYALAMRGLIRQLESQNVVYAEVTLSAGVVLWKKQSLVEVFAAAAEEAQRSRTHIRWILDATRQWGAEAAAPVFEFAAQNRGRGVVAVGLGGFEAQGPAIWFKELFAEARTAGLRLACHAGETTGPRSIWEALEIGAERIGHGIRAIEDPQLLAALRDRNIPLEVCITSNARTGAVRSMDAHPLRRLFDAGVPLTLNTDDPALFDCSLTGEYELAVRQFGFSLEELTRMAGNAFRYAFDPPAEVPLEEEARF